MKDELMELINYTIENELNYMTLTLDEIKLIKELIEKGE